MTTQQCMSKREQRHEILLQYQNHVKAHDYFMEHYNTLVYNIYSKRKCIHICATTLARLDREIQNEIDHELKNLDESHYTTSFFEEVDDIILKYRLESI